MEESLEVTKMWEPSCRKTNMDIFREHICKKCDLKLENYWQLYDWSIQEYPLFWNEVSTFCKIIFSKGPTEIFESGKEINEIPKWFKGAKLNYAENLLRFRDNRIALYITGEAHPIPKAVTFAQLYDRVSRYAAAMRKLGITSRDCIVGYLPNAQEALEAYLATASIGAIWSSTSPDFGVTAVLDRFQQIKPKLLFSTDQVLYNGKIHSHLEKLSKVALGLPELLKVVIISENFSANDTSHIPKSCSLTEFLETGVNNDGLPPDLEFTQVPFNHPLAILYSSGTTGVPKGMVHSVGGTLIQHLKEHVIHGNLNEKDVIFYYTTIGWMMWNWLVSALSVGATLVLYDGSPILPNSSILFDLVDKLGITILGTSAKWLAVAEQKNIRPKTTHDLSSLHTILSSGSPLKPQSYDYVYEWIKSDLMLGSITGGSDIISCFAGQNTAIPVYRGEIQCPNLGMAIECRDETGEAVLGLKGELVCTKPFPCMPIYFWDDPEGLKYQKAYFNNFPGVWSHGDFCIFNPITRGIVMLGRSDSILNPNGVRFGSAEIYNVVEALEEIQDSLCVSQNIKNGEERVILFLKLTNKYKLDKRLLDKIKAAIRVELSARHLPAVILETTDIPYTISGKKVEVAVKKIINGEDVKQRGALANPESLDLYYNIPELTGDN